MPKPDQIFAKLEGDRYFSTFHVTKGYWQILMSEEDKLYIVFITHEGLHQFKVMPLVFVNAPATFSRSMRKLLYGNKVVVIGQFWRLLHSVNPAGHTGPAHSRAIKLRRRLRVVYSRASPMLKPLTA